MNSEKMTVNFVCQRCQQPIKIDESFNSIDEHTMAEITLPINDYKEIDLVSQSSTSMDHFVPPFRFGSSANETNGFMLLSEGPDKESLSQNLKVKADLFDALTSNSEIDHPLCDECADTLLELMDKQLKEAEDEWNDYNNYLQKLEQSDDVPNIEELEKELGDLKLEEDRLLGELSVLVKEEDAIKESLKEQEQKREQLQNEEEKYWREYTKHRRDLIAAEDEYKSLECQQAYASYQLERLKKTNIFNVTFHIWFSGHFGTINGFRLGKLPSAPVEWPEINAAWGQTCLLLHSLAKKMDLTFKNYRLVPYGNHSYIEVLSDGKELPLYGSGGFKFFWDTKFDAAMVAFLDCLQQFKEKVETVDSGFNFPYRMEKGKIEEPSTGNTYSIKIQFNSEEQWTKALKFMLVNLRWGITWIASQLEE